MDTKNELTLSFIVEWFDINPQVTKRYLLKYYPETNEAEMSTMKRRKFLARSKADNESLTRDDFYIGATIILFSRDLKLVEYGDNDTRDLLTAFMETSVVVITPNACMKVGQIMKSAEDDLGLTVMDIKAFQIEDDVVSETAIILGLEPHEIKIGHDNDNENDSNNGMNFMIAIEFRGKDCVKSVATLQELKDVHGRKCLVASSSSDEAKVYKNLFLTKKHKSTAKYCQNELTTCCVVKPHAIKERKVGAIIDNIINRGYKISALQLFHLNRTSAAEFYEVYKTAVKDYNSMVDELCSGPVLALEVICDVEKFRNEIAGPWVSKLLNVLDGRNLIAHFAHLLFIYLLE